jgi:hypothetical protein
VGGIFGRENSALRWTIRQNTTKKSPKGTPLLRDPEKAILNRPMGGISPRFPRVRPCLKLQESRSRPRMGKRRKGGVRTVKRSPQNLARRLTRRSTTGSRMRLGDIPDVVALRYARHLGQRVDALDAWRRRELHELLSQLLPPSPPSGDAADECFSCDTHVGRARTHEGDCFHCTAAQGQRAILRRMLRAV